MSDTSNRRRLRNTFLEPRLQLRYGMYCFAFVAVAVVVAQLLTFFSVRAEAMRVLTQAGGDAAILSGIVDVAMRSALLRGAWLFPLIAAVALFGSAHLIHRFIGPMVPLKRTLERLRAGEYGSTCRIRERDEMHELVAELNDLSATLQERHSTPEDERVREAGFSIIEVLAVLATLSIIVAVVVAQFLSAYDRARQRGTMADMRMVASANGAFYVDNSSYAPDLDTLSPYYFQPVPGVDRWGYAWSYTAAGKNYTFASYGADGIPGPAAPTPWNGDPYECDLVIGSGAFSQAPATEP